MSTAAGYLAALARGEPVDPTGLFGRVLRGRTPADFERLSDDPARRLVFVMGADGLAAMAGASGRDRLASVGYTPEYVEHLLGRGYRFRLAAFPLEPVPDPATWGAVAAAAEATYPELEGRLLAGLDAVASRPLAEHEAAAGVRFAVADRAGRGHPGFYTAARLAASAAAPWQLRAFLYHELHLTELFAGDGYTRDPHGNRVLREYLVPAVPVASLRGLATWDLDVAPDRARTGQRRGP